VEVLAVFCIYGGMTKCENMVKSRRNVVKKNAGCYNKKERITVYGTAKKAIMEGTTL
jgi:hypothetical protein